MRNTVKAAIAALIACASTADAATFISFDGSTGVFGNDSVTGGSFSDTIDLGTLAAGEYLISATISSTYQEGQEAVQDIDFTTVSLNGINFDIGSTGQNEYRFVNSVLSQGQNLFSIAGSSGTNSSYSGTVNVAAIPEPTTWGMFLAGFGALGIAMRRRNTMRVSALQAI